MKKTVDGQHDMKISFLTYKPLARQHNKIITEIQITNSNGGMNNVLSINSDNNLQKTNNSSKIDYCIHSFKIKNVNYIVGIEFDLKFTWWCKENSTSNEIVDFENLRSRDEYVNR